MFDAAFHDEIRSLRPDWFVLQSDFLRQKKQQLLEMAKKGEPRPSQETKLGKTLSTYVSKKSPRYDADFDKKIRALGPDWFVTRSDIANQKKYKLLEMANNGEPKPLERTKMGIALKSYTKRDSGSYNPEFDKKIRVLKAAEAKKGKK